MGHWQVLHVGEPDIVEVHVLGLVLKFVGGGVMEGGVNFSTGKNSSFKLLDYLNNFNFHADISHFLNFC